MARYVQASTDNPFGHTPWQTALYTTFGDFAWLKQPQNAVIREPAGIAPRIRKPPEMAGMELVTGSGRRLGLDTTAAEARFAGLWRMAGGSGSPFASQTVSRVIDVAPLPARFVTPTTPVGVAQPVRVSPNAPIRVVNFTPPAVTPPPAASPTPVMTSSGTISTYTPGATGPVGSPFAAPAAIGPPAAPAPAAAPSIVDQVSAWLSSSMFGGIPNYWLAIGAGALLLSSGGRKGRF